MLNGTNKTSGVNLTPVKIANIITTNRFMPKLIKALAIEDKITIYLGKLIFRIKSPLATIEFIPVVVASVKNPHKDIPKSKTIG